MSSAANMLPTLRKKKTRKDMPRRVSTFDGAPVEMSTKDKNKVQDRIKKRLSTKIGMPSMPITSNRALPPGALQNVGNANRIHIPRDTQPGGVGARPRAARPVYDPSVFDDPDFDAEVYVKKMLATASPAELDSFFQALQDSKDATNTALQENVFHNYKEFITISKEIGTLESDMATIRTMLGELKVITTSMQRDSSAAEENQTRSAGRRGARNSIVDFNQLNKNHLRALWSQVEGAQKFLPADEGRRIVRESGAWQELNAATWRPKEKVHLVLLNDHLLIAQKRPRPNGSSQRLIAQRCFSLTDIRLRSFQDEDMQSAVSVKLQTGGEKYVFKADTQDEKKAMLLAFVREAAELQASMRREDVSDKRLTGSHDTSRDSQIERLSRRLSKTPGLQRNGSVSLPQVHKSNGNDNKGMKSDDDNDDDDGHDVIDLGWVQERMDSLDQRIAHREYREAVRSVLRGRALVQNSDPDNDLAARLTSLRLDARTDRLAHLLCAELADDNDKSRLVSERVGLLVALDRTALARETFLAARSALVGRRSRGVLFEGDLTLYLADLALVHFTLIGHTATVYEAAFGAAAAGGAEMSALVAWAKGEVERFAGLFARQLHGRDRDSALYRDALDAVSRQIAVLRDVGLDLAFVVQQVLDRS